MSETQELIARAKSYFARYDAVIVKRDAKIGELMSSLTAAQASQAEYIGLYQTALADLTIANENLAAALANDQADQASITAAQQEAELAKSNEIVAKEAADKAIAELAATVAAYQAQIDADLAESADLKATLDGADANLVAAEGGVVEAEIPVPAEVPVIAEPVIPDIISGETTGVIDPLSV